MNNNFRILANATLFNYHIFMIPLEIGKKLDNIYSGTLEFQNKTYPLTISGVGKYNVEKDGTSYSDSYRAIISECGNEFEVLFCHTFMTLQNSNDKNKKSKENSEYMDIEYTVLNNTVKMKIVNIHTINNEYTNYFRKLAKRNELALSTKHDDNLKSLIKYSSDWIPIEELDKHKNVKKCIYMWIDENKKYIYIGKADDLYTRMTQHKATPKDEAKCIRKYGDTFNITHFRYDTVNPFVAETLLEALEMRSIQTIANLLPNRSKGKQKIKGFINNSEWKQINNQYSYH